MAFFDFLRNFSQKEEKRIEKKEIQMTDLNEFLNYKIREEQEKLKPKIDEIAIELEKEKFSLKENILYLEKAEPKNKEIPEKAKQLMEGNRSAYCKRVNELVEEANLPSSPLDILNFASRFNDYLNNFDKTISRNHLIMQEFFVEKAGKILMNIKNIDRLVKDAKKEIECSKIQKLAELEYYVNELGEKIKQKQENLLKLDYLESESSKIKNKVAKIEKEIEEFKLREEYKGLIDKITRKELLEKEIKENERNFLFLFSEVEQAVKKYENLSKNSVAKKYLERPFESLLEDKNLEILPIFQSIKNSIEKDEITLKERKKDNTIKTFFMLNKEHLVSLVDKHINKTQELDELNNAITKSKVKEDLYNINKELHKEKQDLKEKEQEIEKAKEFLEDYNIEVLVKELENNLNSLLNQKVEIR